MNFVKLTHNLNISDYVVNDTFVSYGFIHDTIFKGITYSKTNTSFKSKIFSLIPEEYQHYYNISVMKINSNIPPHIDRTTTASINCYIKTGNCTTHFYKRKSEITEPETPAWNSGTVQQGRIFSLNDLDEVDKFYANPGDIYLLDVSKPHLVKSPPDVVYVDRVAICLQTDKFNFNETMKLLKATENL